VVALPVVVGDGLVGVGAAVDLVGDEVGVEVGVEAGAVVGAVVGVVGVVGVEAGVVGAVVGVCEVGVGEGDGLDEDAGSRSGSHDWPPGLVAALATAVLAAPDRPTPEAAVSRTLPAINVTVAGRACAKRMKRPYQCCSLLLWNDSSSWSGFMTGDSSARRHAPPIGHPAPWMALPALLPG
jgi:hypothetical protein